MINHALCLLTNLDGEEAQDYTLPAAELIDPTFRPLTFPGYINTLRGLLFGAGPDQSMLFYRCRQLLAVIHGTSLEDYVTALDTRITYRFADTDLVTADRFEPVITPIGTTLTHLNLFGTPLPPDVTGVSRHTFLVRTLTSTTIEVIRQTKPFQNVVFDFTVVGSAQLMGSGYQFTPAAFNGGDQWLVDVTNRPQLTPADLVTQVGSSGAPVLDALFGLSPPEPYATFRNLWFSDMESPLRLAALLLALIYRSEEVRLG